MAETTLQDIAIATARIDEKLDGFLREHIDMRSSIKASDARLDVLEHAHARVKGFLWTIISLGGLTTFVLTVYGDVTQWFRH